MTRRALALAILVATSNASADFLSDQLAIPRFRKAHASRAADVEKLFTSKGLAWPPAAIFLRAFKLDDTVELWGRDADGKYVLVKAFAVCARSGDPGPKRTGGDGQVPEGFYTVDRFNPSSNFHLSLGLDYPNASDRIRGQKPFGGDIFIHGSCVTIGCLPLKDGPIEELYVAAVAARSAGQKKIEVHVFPGRMDPAGWKRLETASEGHPELLAFWRELKPAYDLFEETRQIPRTRVSRTGAYLVEKPTR